MVGWELSIQQQLQIGSSSMMITEPLTTLITSQSLDLRLLETGEVSKKRTDLRKSKEEFFKQKFHLLHQQAGSKLKRHQIKLVKRGHQYG